MNPYVVAFFIAAFIGFVYFAVVRELVNRDARGLAESTGVLVSGLRARDQHPSINIARAEYLCSPTTKDTARACSSCQVTATHYYHDAGPFGAGTFYGCDEHAPADASPLQTRCFTDTGPGVSGLRARQLAREINDKQVRVIAPGKVGWLVSMGEGDSRKLYGSSAPAPDRVLFERLPLVAPEPLGGDRPTAGKVTPKHAPKERSPIGTFHGVPVFINDEPGAPDIELRGGSL